MTHKVASEEALGPAVDSLCRGEEARLLVVAGFGQLPGVIASWPRDALQTSVDKHSPSAVHVELSLSASVSGCCLVFLCVSLFLHQ